MNRFEELKKEIAEMSTDDFIKNFITGQGMRDYICGAIEGKVAECCQNNDYDCLHCIRNFLNSEVTK